MIQNDDSVSSPYFEKDQSYDLWWKKNWESGNMIRRVMDECLISSYSKDFLDECCSTNVR